MAGMIFFNVGWMNHYAGTTATDRPVGGHGHLKTSSRGAEEFNFSSINGINYGYRPPGDKGIAIGRLGAKSNEKKVDGVTVVWIATRPGTTDTLIVGWYRNATVWRGPRPIVGVRNRAARKFRGYPNPDYMVEAKASDCHLVSADLREFHIKSSRKLKGSFGQSPTFYDEHDLYRSKVEKYILEIEKNIERSPKPKSSGGGGASPRNMDPKKRKEVEETAVANAIAYFSSKDGGLYNVKRVDREAKGWDIECERDDRLLKVEVKGCSGSDIRVELTPNEWSKMSDPQHSADYIVYVVTDCLSKVPSPSIFRYVSPMIWRTTDGRELRIEVRPGARLSCEY